MHVYVYIYIYILMDIYIYIYINKKLHIHDLDWDVSQHILYPKSKTKMGEIQSSPSSCRAPETWSKLSCARKNPPEMVITWGYNGNIIWGYLGIISDTWVFSQMELSPNGWFRMEHPIKIRMMTGGTPIYGNHHINHDKDITTFNEIYSDIPFGIIKHGNWK